MSENAEAAVTADTRTSVLMISKPIVAPWNDSGKNLVRDIVATAPDHGPLDFRVMTTRGAELPPGAAAVEPIYGAAGTYSPSLKQNLRVLKRLLKPDRVPVYHFFFAPNPRTSKMARMVLKLKKRASVHTICSCPKEFEGIGGLMFADRIVVLSEHTRAAMAAQGLEGLVHIPPAVPDRPVGRAEVTDVERAAVRERYGLGDARVVLYAGDYEFSQAADAVKEMAIRLLTDGAARTGRDQRGLKVLFACRIKQEASRPVEARIREEVASAGVADDVVFLNEIDDIETLVAAADVQVQPAGNLYAKMDLPLVLLESLREGVPVVLADRAPLNEILTGDVGVAVAPEDGEALAASVGALLQDEEKRRRMGDNGRRVVAERYSAAAMGRAYAELYAELLAAKGMA